MTSPTAWRWQARGAALGCFATAAVLVWLCGVDMAHLFHGLTARSPVVASSHYAMAALLLCPMAIGLGIFFLTSRQATPEEMKNISPRTETRARYFLTFVAISIGAALVAPTLQYLVVDRILHRRGYVSCPTPSWPRHQPDRWALPGPRSATEACPGEGADPNA